MIKNKVLFITSNKEDLDSVLNKIRIYDNYLVLAFRNTHKLLNKKIRWKNEYNYIGDINKDAFFEGVLTFRKWGSIKLENGKTLKDFLCYKDLDLWDCIESNFVSKLIEHYDERLQYTKLMKLILLKEKPSKLIISNNFDVPCRAAIAVSRSTKVNYEVLNFKKNKKYKQYLIRYIRNIKAYLRKHKIQKITKDKKIIIFLTIPSSFFTIEPAIKLLRKKYSNNVIVIRQEIRVKDQLRNLLDKEKIDYNDFESYTNKGVREKIREFKEVYKRRWNYLIRDKNFRSSFLYQGINLWNLVDDIFDYFFDSRFWIGEVISFHLISKEIINTENPGVIVSMDESSALVKPLFKYAISQKIPIIYLQHGILSNREPTSYKNFLVDKIAVYGKRDIDFFTKRGANKNSIYITGLPKLDYIPKYKRDKNFLYKKFNLNPNKKIILLTTAVHKEINIPMFLAAVKAAKKLDKQLVIKKHPGDQIEDKEYYEMAKKFNLNILIKNEDLYDLFYICDIVLSFNSTTALEAIAFNKPVIALNLTNKKEDFPYTKSGACYGVFKSEDLPKTINEVLYNKEIIKKLKKNMKKILEDTFYKLDGKSTQRLVKLIEEVVKK